MRNHDLYEWAVFIFIACAGVFFASAGVAIAWSVITTGSVPA